MTLPIHLRLDRESDTLPSMHSGSAGLAYRDTPPGGRWHRAAAGLAGAGAALALALAITGCSAERAGTASRSTSAPAVSGSAGDATLPAGWLGFNSKRYSVGFGAPVGWIHVEPGTEEFDRGVEAAGLADNEAVQAVVDQAAVNGDYYFVFDTNSIGNTGTRSLPTSTCTASTSRALARSSG